MYIVNSLGSSMRKSIVPCASYLLSSSCQLPFPLLLTEALVEISENQRTILLLSHEKEVV